MLHNKEYSTLRYNTLSNKNTKDNTYTITNQLPLTKSNLSYLYVNSELTNSIKTILYNEHGLLNSILLLKKDAGREKMVELLDKYLDRFLFAPSSLYFLMVTDKRIEDENDYINLNSKILQSVIGKNQTSNIMDFLISYGFLECDNHFIKGSKSYGYRFAPAWRAKLAAGTMIFTRKETDLLIQDTYVDKVNDKDFILRAFQEIEFDSVLGEQICEEYLNELEPKDRIKKERYYKFILNAWENRDYFLKVSKKSGRIFTLLSSTPRILRKCLSLGGQPLVSCDIKSCQPLLLHTFYKEECQESIKYKQLVESGLFYQHIIESLFVDFNPKSKDKYKEIIWEWAFGTKYMQEFKVVNQFFLDSFPKLTKLLIKSKDRIEAGEKRPHSKTAIHLQKMEANVMVKELIEYCKLNNLFYLTIHDSILAPEDQINKLSLFISDKFKTKYNLAPNFEIKLVD